MRLGRGLRKSEFPDDIVVLMPGPPVPVKGGGTEPGPFIQYDDFKGKLSTPSSSEVYDAHQLNYTFDRNLYYPYRTDIEPNMLIVCKDNTYSLVSEPMDQGGQNEVMKLRLKLVK